MIKIRVRQVLPTAVWGREHIRQVTPAQYRELVEASSRHPHWEVSVVG